VYGYRTAREAEGDTSKNLTFNDILYVVMPNIFSGAFYTLKRVFI
jgi:hypothetical protein